MRVAMNTTAAAIASMSTMLPSEMLLPAPDAGFGFGSPAAAIASMPTMASDARIWWPGNSPAAVSSVSRCQTTYGSEAPPWGPSTDFFTSTSYAYRTKTEVLTPKPFTTSVTATSTYTQFETAPNNLTQTVYTSTYTWTNYITTTSVVSETSTITSSVFSSTTVPTPDGFTPVASVYPEATQHVDDWEDRENWAVEDTYWQDEGSEPWAIPLDLSAPMLFDARVSGAVEGAVPTSTPTDQASKVDCLVTLVNIYDSGTSTSKSSVVPPTYTRTKYVSTETITSTVTTKISPTETPYTYNMASGLEIRSTYTEISTNTETTTITEYPSSTTTSYAACATDNVVDSFDGFPLDRLAADWYSKNLTIIRSDWNTVSNATACCNVAAQEPNAIFFKYDYQCEVFLADEPGYGYNESKKINVEVLYEPRERGWYGTTYGNGLRGSISFSSLWL